MLSLRSQLNLFRTCDIFRLYSQGFHHFYKNKPVLYLNIILKGLKVLDCAIIDSFICKFKPRKFSFDNLIWQLKREGEKSLFVGKGTKLSVIQTKLYFLNIFYVPFLKALCHCVIYLKRKILNFLVQNDKVSCCCIGWYK